MDDDHNVLVMMVAFIVVILLADVNVIKLNVPAIHFVCNKHS